MTSHDSAILGSRPPRVRPFARTARVIPAGRFTTALPGCVSEDFGTWETTDGGVTWTEHSSPVNPLYRFRTLVLTPDRWLLACHGEGGELWETTDAGSSWTQRQAGASVGFLSDLWYINIINATGAPPPCVIGTVMEPQYVQGHLAVPIELSAVEGKTPITGIDLVFGFNSEVLEVTGVSFDGTLLDGLGWGYMLNEPSPGELRVGLAGTTPLPGSGTLILAPQEAAEAVREDGPEFARSRQSTESCGFTPAPGWVEVAPAGHDCRSTLHRK